MTTAAQSTPRDPQGRFQPGCSGNPAGKRPGTLNHAIILRRLMAEGDEAIIGHLILNQALKGEWRALRFVFERLEPKPRARAIEWNFPEHATLAEMSMTVFRAMAAGEISAEEALQIMRYLEKAELHRAAGRAAEAAARPVAAAPEASRPAATGRAAARRPADPPAVSVAPAAQEAVLHSASISTPPRAASPSWSAPVSTRRRPAAAAAAAATAAIAPLSPVAGLAAGVAGRADAQHSTCNLQP